LAINYFASKTLEINYFWDILQYISNAIYISVGLITVGCIILGGAFILGNVWRNSDNHNQFNQVMGDHIQNVESKLQLLEGLLVRKYYFLLLHLFVL
jgi:hypothetical protein